MVTASNCCLFITVILSTDPVFTGFSISMAVSIPGFIAMVIFYLLVLAVGIWASIKSKREESKSTADKMDMALLGNRSITKVVGIFTMTGEALHCCSGAF